MDNYFTAEQPIIDRLKEQLPEIRVISSSRNLDTVIRSNAITPGAHVIFDGEGIEEDSRHRVGSKQIVYQKWLVVLSIKSNRDIPTGSGIRWEAGPLLLKINNALQGWKPATGFGGMAKAPSKVPVYQDNIGHFSLSFTSRVVL
jgi:hypothetical protein